MREVVSFWSCFRVPLPPPTPKPPEGVHRSINAPAGAPRKHKKTWTPPKNPEKDQTPQELQEGLKVEEVLGDAKVQKVFASFEAEKFEVFELKR